MSAIRSATYLITAALALASAGCRTDDGANCTGTQIVQAQQGSSYSSLVHDHVTGSYDIRIVVAKVEAANGGHSVVQQNEVVSLPKNCTS